MEDEIILTSPVPQKNKAQRLLTFPEAIKEIIDGKTITKKEWNNPECYCQLKDARLKIMIAGEFKDWIISEGDLVGDDWVILEIIRS